MFFIAWKNLIKERTRLVLTLLGVTFAVVLMFFDLGAYLGFVRASSVLIDHSDADIWITAENNVNFDSARPFPERKLSKVKEVPGFQWAEMVVMGWGLIKLKDGATETVQMVGFNPEKGVGGPWKLREGSIKDLKVDDTIIVDESSLRKLGGLRVGDTFEIFDTQVKVVGISQDVKSFTTYPVAFTNYETAKRLSGIYRLTNWDQTTFILAKVTPGVPVGKVVERLQGIKGVDVYTKEDFAWKTRKYWIIQTGMGIGFGLTALLGFLVGMVIVGQTIYASTLEHLREFGTLKAIGATNRDLLFIIVYQALVNAILGYLIGLAIAMVIGQGYERFGLNLTITTGLEVAMFGITLAMCLGSSILSIRRAFRIDPVIVFRA
ncbi:MAG: FtsX-like permease family protein [candidate division NC10 bacterium]|nr:FtsX-like permease family protein [candidate division NC10 bacterium]